jgi:serine/threonine protein kinase
MNSETLGNYRIEGELGRGGMGVVYRATELDTDNTVALKVLSREFAIDPAFVKRFKRETEALAKLDHPNIVKIHAVGEDQGTHYYAMDFVEGYSLSDLISEGEKFDVGRALDLALSVAAALGHAHKSGIIHRDIKPGNILIGRDGRPKLTDFGVARLTYATRMTRTGDIVGTPEYMSPEQSKGTPVGKSSDVYSLGVVIYELLTGNVPFEGATALEIIQKHQYEGPQDIKSLNRAVPDALARVVMRMLAKDSKERYKSAEQAATALSMIRPTVIRAAASREKLRAAKSTMVQEAHVEVLLQVPGRKQCPQCDSELDPGDRICIGCGTDVTTGKSAKEVALKRARKRLTVKVATTVGAAIPLAGLAAVVALRMGTFYIKTAFLSSTIFCIVTLIGGSVRRESVIKRLYVGILVGLLITVLYGLLWSTSPPFSPLLSSPQ